ncbi:putative bifunctional diguanylate cyclase/phosphodiesterase [Acanthopleuribacter pedis]|uniref:EAL domain-containing protein n=1 Tax=Acanthopleuribacter pedis TaxID=442870 RepID=A0A8J7QF91_9BACT|nr:EAL domain-containing protein [Acanthopleuribacter pedis]MBO1323229.1 EAL domain-containing protein [Acanthopleuribacter pedis]
MDPQQYRLLVVDDFDLNRDLLMRRLRSYGYQAEEADGGLACLAQLEKGRFDLILLDIMMPDMDGFEIVAKVRERWGKDIMIIMVTAKDNSSDVVRALDLGADDYVTKPIDFAIAKARIKNLLARKEAEDARHQSEERLALALRGSEDGLWDWDLKLKTIYYSDQWKAMLGLQKVDLGNTLDAWFDRIHDDDLPRLRKQIQQHLNRETERLSCEIRICNAAGEYLWMLCRGMALFDADGLPYRMAGWMSDTSGRGDHDVLTALPGRSLFIERISAAAKRSQIQENHLFAVYCVGIDRFRVVNESLGHRQGDHILQMFARRLEGLLPPGCTLSRLGSDEFAILVEPLAAATAAKPFADKIRTQLARPFVFREHELHITSGIGIVLGSPELTGEDMLRRAHTALDQAKLRGKNSIHFYQNSMSESLMSELKMESELRKAIERDELYVEYQPQIDSETGRIIGAEALLRWHSREYGKMPPGRFIPLAEETMLILPIGEWVLEQACAQNQAWVEMGLPAIRIAVNLSSRQFQDYDIVGLVKRVLDKTGLDPHKLDLELTESLLMDNVEETIAQLEGLHDLGVQLSVDDFGTGYSSLAYLKRFPLDMLKIDRSFVTHITSDKDDASICSAIIGMAHNLRMKVIAEGVETEDHLVYLRSLTCDELQGYLFSPPRDAAGMELMLRENKRWFE